MKQIITEITLGAAMGLIIGVALFAGILIT
jgi:hypothetical protein